MTNAIRHTAKTTADNVISIYDANDELIATTSARSKDGNIRMICWFGGEKHGKTELTEGGIEGMMEYIGMAA